MSFAHGASLPLPPSAIFRHSISDLKFMFHPPPHRWPQHLQYITEPAYHPSVPENIRNIICPRRPTRPQTHTHKPPVAIQNISHHSHPARGQCGLFAAKKIPPRSLIIDYVGEVHCDDRPGSDYDLSLFRTPDRVSVGVDAQSAGNEARFINDYRGVKQKPNAFFQERRTESGELRMSVWSGSEAIKKGDELLVSYGKSWWKARHSVEAEEAELFGREAESAS